MIKLPLPVILPAKVTEAVAVPKDKAIPLLILKMLPATPLKSPMVKAELAGAWLKSIVAPEAVSVTFLPVGSAVVRLICRVPAETFVPPE